MAFMFNIGMVNIGMVKSCRPFRATAHAPKTAQPDYNAASADFPKAKIK